MFTQKTLLAHGSADLLLCRLQADDDARWFFLLPERDDPTALVLWIPQTSPRQTAFAECASALLHQILLDAKQAVPAVASLKLVTI